MNVNRINLAASGLRSLAWDGDTLADWTGGARYYLDGTCERSNVGYACRFDAAVGVGQFGVSFEVLGTKGRLAVTLTGALPAVTKLGKNNALKE